MTDRKWHLEHADGREWTMDELRPDYADDPYPDVAINDAGTVYFISCDELYLVDHEDGDMVVVWDE